MTTNETASSEPVAAPRRHVISLLLGALPGLLGGAYVTGLLFFLNPELDPAPGAVLRGVAFYGAVFGAASAAVSLLLAGRRPGRAEALLPWWLTGVLVIAAGTTWTHAWLYAHDLPPGINVRLVKAAVALSLFAFVAFLTALLHTLDRRRYGSRSRLLLAVLSVAVLYTMIERRAAFEPQPEETPLDSFTAYSSRPELWVVGIDGATLDAILPLVEQGELPFFQQLLDEGVAARLESYAALSDGALWTTLATGHHAYRHGVVSDRVYTAAPLQDEAELRLVPLGYRWWGFNGGRPRPVDASQRRYLALWEILSRLDIPAGVVGWPASHPPRGTLSYVFADRYFEGDATMAEARPSELAQRGLMFRLGAGEIAAEQAALLGDTPPFPLMQALGDDLWRESLIDFLLDQRPEVDALFLRLEGLAVASSRYFGAFARVQFGGAQDPERQLGARLLAGYYRHLDHALGRLATDAPANRLLVVVSPFGYQAPEGWRRLTRLAGAAALEGTRAGAPDGLVLIRGPGIAGGRRLPDARGVDLLPTILHALGLPIARDLDGRVLTGAFEQSFLARRPLTFVPSYETLSLEASPPPGPELIELTVPPIAAQR